MVKYPAVTVILDLSAREEDITNIGMTLCQSGLFEKIIQEFNRSFRATDYFNPEYKVKNL